MTGRLKKHTIFLLCATLLNAALCSPTRLFAEKAIPVHIVKKTAQATENHKHSNEIQENSTQVKKPTILKSWHKVATLRWKKLGKADAWNIGAPIASIVSIGLLAYYWPKNIIPDTHYNPAHNNPGDGTCIPSIISMNDHPHTLNSANTLSANLNNTINQPILPEADSSSNDSSNFDSSSDDDSETRDADDSLSLSNSDYSFDSSIECDIDENFKGLLSAANNPANIAIAGDDNINNQAATWMINFAINNLNPDTSNPSSSSDADSRSTDTTNNSNNSSNSSSDDDSSSTDTTNSSDSSSDTCGSETSASNSSTEESPEDRKNNELIFLTPEQRKNIACLYDNEVLIYNVQNKIALDMITDFLMKPKILLRHMGILSVVITTNNVVTISANRAKIWDIHDGLVLREFNNAHGASWHTTLNKNIKIRGYYDTIAKTWEIYNNESIITATNNDTCMISISEDGIAQICPLSVDLNSGEFTNPDHALFWIKHNLLPFQANLIARAHTATQTEKTFKIHIDTDDAHIWITFPAHVRIYLCERLNIELIKIQDCALCLEQKNINEFHIMNGCNESSGCKSSFCTACLLEHITIHLDEGNTHELTCPNVKCAKKMHQSDIQTITQKNKDLFDRFDKIAFAEFIMQNNTIKNCPTADCECTYEINTDEIFRFKCPSCKAKYCSHCQYDHRYISCEDAALMDRDCADCATRHARNIPCDAAARDRAQRESSLVELANRKIKPCPHCKTFIEKNMGCNHMTCKRCKYQFCWTCLARYGTTECDSSGCAVLNIETGYDF